jgi:hypothetical protein
MYYNRMISPALKDALGHGGPFSILVRYAKTKYLADLQLRGYPYSKRYWATLYCGTTKVLDVFERYGQFWVKGKSESREWNESWTKPRKRDEWKSDEKELNKYLDRTIRDVGERYTNEGAIQAMLCTRAGDLFSVIDRETVIGFSKETVRVDTYERLQRPLQDACPPDPSNPWFVPKKFGGELDLLAVDPNGRLLAIEVKPGSNLTGITWAPLQATFYAELLREWANEAGQESQRILQDMLKQRIDLGLTHDPNRSIKYPLEIVPVVAIGGAPKSSEAHPRLKKVQRTFLDAKVGYPSLEVWQVEDSVKRMILLAKDHM